MRKLLFFLLIPFIGFSQTPITQSNIHAAVDLWLDDDAASEAEYASFPLGVHTPYLANIFFA